MSTDPPEVTDDTFAVADAVAAESPGESGFEPIEMDTWRWQFSDEADVAVDAVAPLFDSQESAEDWLTRNFELLRAQGVAAVSLFDGEGAVYGPMALAPDSPDGPDNPDGPGTPGGPDGPGEGFPDG